MRGKNPKILELVTYIIEKFTSIDLDTLKHKFKVWYYDILKVLESILRSELVGQILNSESSVRSEYVYN